MDTNFLQVVEANKSGKIIGGVDANGVVFSPDLDKVKLLFSKYIKYCVEVDGMGMIPCTALEYSEAAGVSVQEAISSLGELHYFTDEEISFIKNLRLL